MATVTRETLDGCTRAHYYVQTPDKGLQRLPFDLVTIDADEQFYQPHDGSERDSNLRRVRGRILPPVILADEWGLPKGMTEVWEYHGL
jgi:hypothetical protein